MVTVPAIVWIEPETAVKVDVAADATRALAVVTVLWETTEVSVDVTTPRICTKVSEAALGEGKGLRSVKVNQSNPPR